MTDQPALPRYRCHKEVSALKIATITPFHRFDTPAESGAVIVPVEVGYGAFRVSDEYLRKHNPQVGGYYVVYEDGYLSFSPSEAFESGYTKIS
jgi:hypothetical protein